MAQQSSPRLPGAAKPCRKFPAPLHATKTAAKMQRLGRERFGHSDFASLY
ncbi:hypothetical protein LT85_4878 [Collimonas arenae]|uniref:Uncharacterized protein n=1 Tax=Collimonas arenae TaxID=279058 RepID=A0A0A1FHH7_9BURK|nr:hypothetical protein LT85_4878 [Collimonas arenae]